MAQVRDFLASAGRSAPAAGGQVTQVMATRPAAAVPTLPAPAPPAIPPVPDPPPAARETGRRRRAWLPLAVAAALVVVLGVLAFVLLGEDDGTSPTIDRPPATETTEGDDGPSDSASSSPAPQGPTARGMEGFVADYLATAPSSPQTGFDMLTPDFQAASGGFAGYSGYWSTIAEAQPGDIQADPDTLVVEYVVDYTRVDGTQNTDEVQLRLQFDNGRYLIAAEP